MSIGGDRVTEDPQIFPMGLGEEGEGFRIHRLPSSSFHLARTLGPLISLQAGVVRESPFILKGPLKDGEVFIRHRCKGHNPYLVIKLPGQLGSCLPHRPKPHAALPVSRTGLSPPGYFGHWLFQVCKALLNTYCVPSTALVHLGRGDGGSGKR